MILSVWFTERRAVTDRKGRESMSGSPKQRGADSNADRDGTWNRKRHGRAVKDISPKSSSEVGLGRYANLELRV